MPPLRDYQNKQATFRRRLPKIEHRHKFQVKVRRTHLFEDSYRVIVEAPVEKLTKRLWVSFEGEEGID